MKIRTETHLQDFLDNEKSWRTQEIHTLKYVIRNSDEVRRRAVLRASLTILYGHWEGFVKASSYAYAQYLSNLPLKYSEVQSCFLGISAREEVRLLAETNKFSLLKLSVDKIFQKREERIKVDLKKHIDRMGNLNFSLFSEILSGLGLDFTPYEGKKVFIDESLLAKRNRVAHGEFIEINAADFDVYANDVISLLNQFKTDIENSVSLKSYKLVV